MRWNWKWTDFNSPTATINAHEYWWDAVFVTVLKSLDGMLCLIVAVYLCFPCFCVKVTVSVFTVCFLLSVHLCSVLLLLNYSYFYLTKMKYESMMILLHTDAILDCHLLHSLCSLLFVLWFVTWHPSPPTSLRFWSTLGWLVIMLMQLCSIKVSDPTPSPSRHHNHLSHSHLPAYHHQPMCYSVILTILYIYVQYVLVCSDIHYQYLLHQL